MKNLAVVIMATGDDLYTNYACDLVNSLRHNFPSHEVLLFTDKKLPVRATIIDHPDLGWPRASLMRYHYMLKQEALLSEFRMIMYLDADMLPVTRVSQEELETEGLLAVLHPGYPVDVCEHDVRSTAYVDPEEGKKHPYMQGCLQGGATVPYLRACRAIAENIDTDDRNGVVAHNYDESHWNRYLISHPPTRVLSPVFAFPGAKYIRNDVSWPKLKHAQPRIRHIDKNIQREW